jgi:7,8-dihydroneopterin aldolase/epimerase/oxygenase
VNTTWTVRIERMELSLPVGIEADELEPQTVWVSLAASGTASADPRSLDQCFDYAPLCHWITEAWPRTPHTALLETRINQLLDFLFGLDVRFETVWVGLYKQRVSRQAIAVGIERSMTRTEFETRSAGRALLAIHSNADTPTHESTRNVPVTS